MTNKGEAKSLGNLNVLSLFSGCGGMDLGFEGDFDVLTSSVNKKLHPNWNTKKVSNRITHLGKNVFHTVFANDIRKGAKTAWTTYFSKKGIAPETYHLESIVDLVKKAKKGNKNIFPESVDIVTGGFPCQDFSVAGKRLGFNSDKGHDGNKITSETPLTENRGHLYMWMKEVVSVVQPKMFIAENVKGLVSLADAKQIIENDFSSISDNGYLVVNARVLHAANYGVPQSRERVIFFGFKKSALTKDALKELSKENISDKYNPYPIPTHSYTVEGKNLLPPVKLEEVFSGLEEPHLSNDLSQQKYSKAKYMGSHCQGQIEIDLQSISPTIRSEHHGNIEFRRLSLKHGGTHNEELNNGLIERRLSIRECAKIQTFPDDYEFILPATKEHSSLSSSDAYKIIGNAVPPLLAYNIAKRIEENWKLYFGE